jgi:predicted nucleic acid-binding protein
MLVDSSVWIEHFRHRNTRLFELLDASQVLIHPLVIGELSCGNFAQRGSILTLLQALPHAPVVEHREAMDFLAAHRLFGRGLGWIDIHLLASAKLARVPLWTLDKRLDTAASELARISVLD